MQYNEAKSESKLSSQFRKKKLEALGYVKGWGREKIKED
jgi:hypothetical protein